MDDKVLNSQKLQVLHFILQKVRFCIDIHYIEKVLSLVLIEMIPNSPPYLVGLMNLAGKSIPVLDLALRLGFTREKPYSLDTPILLCSDGNKRTGLIIDKVLGLADVASAAIQMNTEFSEPDSPFLAAITLESEVSLLINIKRILNFSLTLDTAGKNSISINEKNKLGKINE